MLGLKPFNRHYQMMTVGIVIKENKNGWKKNMDLYAEYGECSI